MTDPLTPPPRRPLPEHLEHRITDELAAARSHRRRIGTIVIPLVAAAVVAALVVIGVTTVRDRQSVFPAETATAVPATTSQTPTPRPSVTATPTRRPANLTLDLRPMTKAEIAADRQSCVRQDEHETPIPYQGPAEVEYAMVQRSAGAAGGGSAVRVLLMADDIGHWVCLDGQQDRWSRGARTSVELTSRVPVAPVTNANGGSGAACGGKSNVVTSSAFFVVGGAVRTGRVRVIRGKKSGPWMTAKPVEGLIYFDLRVTGPAADERNVGMEFAFLDRDGQTVLVASGFANEPPTRSVTAEFSTCADVRSGVVRPKAVVRPRSDAAGIRTCQAMAEESAGSSRAEARGEWKPRLLISTPEEWGMVLSDDRNLVGCSLYPTKEISPFIADTPAVRKSAFFFAVNPIGDTGTASLWAAGRVPADVSAITYRLPGNHDVAAEIDDDGYWMLKYNSTNGQHIGTEENVADWPPVVVTVTRTSGTQRFTIPFSEKTMCRQVSHGC